MTTKNTDTEKKWREEFEALQFKYKNNLERSWNGYVDGEIHSRWIMYEAARKKAHSENEDAFKAFTLDLADRYEKEIQKLKEEIEILKFERVPVELFNESEEKKKYFEEKHHEFANSCNEWKIKYDEEIEKRDKLLERAEVLICLPEKIKQTTDNRILLHQWLKDHKEMKK